MIYCDTAYLLKYYVDEPGSQEVRSLIDAQTGVASLSLGRLELAAAFHRKLRESQIAPATHECLVSQFEADNTSKNFAVLPAKIFLRASDALHLACAKEHGFREIHSNDKHLRVVPSLRRAAPFARSVRTQDKGGPPPQKWDDTEVIPPGFDAHAPLKSEP